MFVVGKKAGGKYLVFSISWVPNATFFFPWKWGKEATEAQRNHSFLAKRNTVQRDGTCFHQIFNIWYLSVPSQRVKLILVKYRQRVKTTVALCSWCSIFRKHQNTGLGLGTYEIYFTFFQILFSPIWIYWNFYLFCFVSLFTVFSLFFHIGFSVQVVFASTCTFPADIMLTESAMQQITWRIKVDLRLFLIWGFCVEFSSFGGVVYFPDCQLLGQPVRLFHLQLNDRVHSKELQSMTQNAANHQRAIHTFWIRFGVAFMSPVYTPQQGVSTLFWHMPFC